MKVHIVNFQRIPTITSNRQVVEFISEEKRTSLSYMDMLISKKEKHPKG